MTYHTYVWEDYSTDYINAAVFCTVEHERGSAGALREEGRGDQAVGAWADYDIRLTRLHARPWVGSSLLWVALHRCR